MKITKKGPIYSCSLLLCLISCKDSGKTDPKGLLCESEYSTANILVDISEEVYNDDESVKAYSKYSWTSDQTSRILSGNGIPNHEVGTFPNPHNPNTIKEQNVNATFTLCPSLVSDTGVQVGGPAGAIAYAINSVKFDPGTAGRCDDSGTCSLAMGQGRWRIEALGHNTFDFGDDMNHAHVQPNGSYHYHGIPELLINFLGNNKGMTLVGWASDGFPVYEGKTSIQVTVNREDAGCGKGKAKTTQIQCDGKVNRSIQEIHIGDMKLKNKEHIFEYAVYFDESYEPLKKGAVVIIGQMHTDNKAKGCHSCCHFWAQDFKYKAEHYYSWASKAAYSSEPVVIGKIEDLKGKWTHLKFHVLWKLDETGRFKIYKNKEINFVEVIVHIFLSVHSLTQL